MVEFNHGANDLITYASDAKAQWGFPTGEHFDVLGAGLHSFHEKRAQDPPRPHPTVSLRLAVPDPYVFL